MKTCVTAAALLMLFGGNAGAQQVWAPSPGGGIPITFSADGNTLGIGNLSLTGAAKYVRMGPGGPQLFSLPVNGEIRKINDNGTAFVVDQITTDGHNLYDCSTTACQLRSLIMPAEFRVTRLIAVSRDLSVVLGVVSNGSAAWHFWAGADRVVHLSPYGISAFDALITEDAANAYMVVVNSASVYMLARWRLDGVSDPELLLDNVWSSDRVLSAKPGNGLLMWRHGQLVRWTEAGELRVIPGCCPTNPSSGTADGESVSGPAFFSQTPLWIWTPMQGVRDLRDVVPRLRELGAVSIYAPRVTPTQRRFSATYGSDTQSLRGLIADLPLDPCPVDFNRDGVEDSADIALVIDLIAGAPNPLELPLDVNRDGSADQDDVAAVISVIAGAGCP